MNSLANKRRAHAAGFFLNREIIRYLELRNCLFSQNFHKTDVFKALFPSLKPPGTQVVDIHVLLPTKKQATQRRVCGVSPKDSQRQSHGQVFLLVRKELSVI